MVMEYKTYVERYNASLISTEAGNLLRLGSDGKLYGSAEGGGGGMVQLADGSAAAPSLSFLSNPKVGIFYVDDNVMATSPFTVKNEAGAATSYVHAEGGNAQVVLNGAGTHISLERDGTMMWQIRAAGDAQHLVVNRFDDAGQNVGTAITINRETGDVTVGGNLVAGGVSIADLEARVAALEAV